MKREIMVMIIGIIIVTDIWSWSSQYKAEAQTDEASLEKDDERGGEGKGEGEGEVRVKATVKMTAGRECRWVWHTIREIPGGHEY